MTRRLVIAIDCDDVLIESTTFLVDAYNAKFGTKVTVERAHDPRNEEWGTLDYGLILERLSILQHTVQYAEIQPLPEAVSAVLDLAKNHELHLITARDKSVERVTMAMLDQYLPNCSTSIEHVGKDRSKGEVCKVLGADILIDDNMKHLIDGLAHGMPSGGALHFGDYPWNSSEVLPEGIVACSDWEAVVQEVHAIARG